MFATVGVSFKFATSILNGASTVDPDKSVARILTANVPTSEFVGVPLRTRVEGLNDNQVEDSDVIPSPFQAL